VNVRIVDVGRVGTRCVYCVYDTVCDSEDRGCGVDVGVNVTMMSTTL
jgi:hypothetical protein